MKKKRIVWRYYTQYMKIFECSSKLILNISLIVIESKGKPEKGDGVG